MGKIGTIARRTFLVGSLAVAGGVAFGVYTYRKDPDNPLLSGMKPGDAVLTPYVRIDQKGVTLIAPRTEMGQGAYSVQAALLAEELDLDWDQVHVEHGPPSEAYYNGALVADGLPFAATDQSFTARNARDFGYVLAKFMGLQITGGSSTVADAFVKLRTAGASARMALVEAAARQSGNDAKRLKTENGAVVLPDGARLSYVSLASAVADIGPPQDVKLKSPDQWRILGKPMVRVDMAEKLNGGRVFGIDRTMPDMVYATVRTNPRIGGGVKSFDDSAAKAMRGVIKVVPIDGGAGVIADNSWRAFQAANAITFDWGDAPYLKSSDEMWAKLANSFTDDFQDSQFKDDGDINAPVEGSTLVEAEYRIPYLAHAPLEPMNAMVLLKDGRLDIWAATQIPLFTRKFAAEIAGLNEDSVHVHVEMAGGSFGRRLEDDYVRQAVQLAKAHPGVPIKMTFSREEDMTHDFPRPVHMGRGKGAVANGKVMAFDLAVAAPSVSASQGARIGQSIPGADVQIVAGSWDQPFAIPNYRVTGYNVPDMAPVSSWRSVGASANGFVHDCFLDELIHAAGGDPMAERIRLCNHVPSRRVLEEVAKLSNWNSPLPKGKGRGVGFCMSFGVPVAEVVEVSDTPAGIKIDKVWAVAEVGTVLDPVNIENQMQGGVIWGLGHAMNCELTYSEGQADQSNFDSYPFMRINQCPEIAVKALATTDQIRGIGEPTVPPAAAALANAIFAATGKRIREMPLSRHISFA